MNLELEKVLCEKYPRIFKNKDASIMDSCMAWGFECEDGWFDIIDILCHEIQTYVDWKSRTFSDEEKESFQVVAQQVKEKFGTLRFYYYGGDEVIEGMVRMAESMSHRICEGCGCPGDERSGRWTKVLCDKCDDKRKAALGVVRCV
jgi:hypothetical protein